MNEHIQKVCDSAGLAALVERLALGLAADGPPRGPVRLVGVRSRGFPIAQRVAALLGERLGLDVPVGAVDITLYRDDLDQSPHWPVLRGTDIPFDVDGTDLVLVDDVLFTGRTVRAAINAICDLGRPARVRLAVLVDRGHRELPIQPDLVGVTVETRRGERVHVRVTPTDDADEVLRVLAS